MSSWLSERRDAGREFRQEGWASISRQPTEVPAQGAPELVGRAPDTVGAHPKSLNRAADGLALQTRPVPHAGCCRTGRGPSSADGFCSLALHILVATSRRVYRVHVACMRRRGATGGYTERTRYAAVCHACQPAFRQGQQGSVCWQPTQAALGVGRRVGGLQLERRTAGGHLTTRCVLQLGSRHIGWRL